MRHQPALLYHRLSGYPSYSPPAYRHQPLIPQLALFSLSYSRFNLRSPTGQRVTPYAPTSPKPPFCEGEQLASSNTSPYILSVVTTQTARLKQLLGPKPPSTGARDLFDLKYGDDGQVIQVTDEFRDIVGSIALSQADYATRPALRAIQELISWDPVRGEKKWCPLAETIQAILDRDWSSTTWDSDISLLRGLWYRLQETVMEMLDVFWERLNLPISLKYNKESHGEHRWMVDDLERLRDLVMYLDREITRVEDTIVRTVKVYRKPGDAPMDPDVVQAARMCGINFEFVESS